MRADSMKLAKLLEKLVCNAVKFTAHGGVVVTIARRSGWTSPGSVIVADSGIGIESGKLSTIFDPFAQGDESTSRKFEGAGLGLPIARALALSMGCSLDVESERNVGTRFELVFPQ